MKSMAGVPLYDGSGYTAVEAIVTGPVDGVSIPLRRMQKAL